ncbi:MAG: hypothetical protein JSR64_13730 [Nitrospira sp.]|nr:hypothetical protein [Nitrospira sp.]
MSKELTDMPQLRGDLFQVVMGQVVQAGSKMNPARQAGIGAGLPVSVPAMTVNRVCGSGAQGIASAAQEVLAGFVKCAIAGGMENMDMAPYSLQRDGLKRGIVTLCIGGGQGIALALEMA